MNNRMDEIRSTANPALREDQIEVLMRYGETRKTEAGQVLSRAWKGHKTRKDAYKALARLLIHPSAWKRGSRKFAASNGRVALYVVLEKVLFSREVQVSFDTNLFS